MNRRMRHFADSVTSGPPAGRAGTYVARAALPLLAIAALAARADSPNGVFEQPGMHGLGAQSCVSELEGTQGSLSAAGECFADSLFAGLLGVTVEFANQYGRTLFGEQFRIDNRMGFASSGGGLGGAIDAVIPVSSFTSATGNGDSRAVFVQNGVSRWTTPSGLEHTDLRFGLVHRFLTPALPGSGVLGASVFFQENLERGHQRVVIGVDYSGVSGSGSLTYFLPTTGWRPGRSGYEEHALEGVELGFAKDATSTISLNAAAGVWRGADSFGEWDTRGRLSLDWRPHPWLALQGRWDDIGTVDDDLGLHAIVEIPFGSNQPRARWQGLGDTRADLDEEPSGQATGIWRSVENVGRIKFAEQQTSSPDHTQPKAGDTAPSGTAQVLFVLIQPKGQS